MVKEFLYVGYYFDVNGVFILKVGTTNDLKRRAQEHTRNYRKAVRHTLPPNEFFNYLWWLPLSRYNTHRYEDKTIQEWQNTNVGKYIRNDRFVCAQIPPTVKIKIRKTYEIPLLI